MDRNFTRDISVLMKIAQHQESITKAMLKFGCRTEREIVKDQMLIDLGSFYLAQIGELMKNISGEAKSSLTFMDGEVLRGLRNIINHTYLATEKKLLVTYMINCQSPEAKQEVKNQLQYCKNEMKKEKAMEDKKPYRPRTR